MFKFSDDVPQIINPEKAHMACLFLVDTSGAMAGGQINNTLKALNAFRDEIKKNKSLCEVLDIAVIEFNSFARVVQEFVPAEYMEPIYLTAHGVSDMNSGLRWAVDKVLERLRIYRRTGTIPYVPWIMLITDGGWPDTPIEDIANEIRELESKDIFRLWMIGTEGSRLENIRNLGLSKRVLSLDKNILIKMFFDLLRSPGDGKYYEKDSQGNYVLMHRERHGQELPSHIGGDDWIDDEDWL